MEKQSFDNKLLKNLGNDLSSLSKLIGVSMRETTKVVTKDLTDDQKIRYKHFQKKIISLTQKGKHQEAEQLKKEYLKENG